VEDGCQPKHDVLADKFIGGNLPGGSDHETFLLEDRVGGKETGRGESDKKIIDPVVDL
jgi:hypothetical protein